MTRQDYVNNVNSLGELINFCLDCDCDICSDIFSREERDEYINSDLTILARNAVDWQDLLDTLQDISTGYGWYIRNEWDDGWGGVFASGETFRRRKQRVLEWADDCGIWDDEEEPVEIEVDDDFVVADEPISINELMTECSNHLQHISDSNTTDDAADDEAFAVFVADCVTIVEGE